jgi:hypothetical protein
MQAIARRGGLAPVFACISLFIAAGCSSDSADSASDREQVYRTAVRVTYKGKPVPGAIVRFISTEPFRLGAAGRTDLAGECRLTTYQSDDGAPVGTYLVLVSKDELPADGPESGGDDSEDYVPPAEDPIGPDPSDNLLPARFNDPARTPLKVAVTAQGPNEFELELGD